MSVRDDTERAGAIVMLVLDRQPTTLAELEAICGRSLDRDARYEARGLIRCDVPGLAEVEVSFVEDGPGPGGDPLLARLSLVTVTHDCLALATRLFGAASVDGDEEHCWVRGDGVFTCVPGRIHELRWRRAGVDADRYTVGGPNDDGHHHDPDGRAGEVLRLVGRVRDWLAKRR